MKRWYVVHAYSGFEKSVAQALRDRISRIEIQDRFGDVLVPAEEVVEMRSGQKRRSEHKFFLGYVLIQIETYYEGGVPRIDNECWHLVKETPKVMGFIGVLLIARCRSVVMRLMLSCVVFRMGLKNHVLKFYLSQGRWFEL